MIHAADTNGDRQIQYEEFAGRMPSLLGELPGSESQLGFFENSTLTPTGDMSLEKPVDGNATDEVRLYWGARGVGVRRGVGAGAPGVGVRRGVGVGAPGVGVRRGCYW